VEGSTYSSMQKKALVTSTVERTRIIGNKKRETGTTTHSIRHRPWEPVDNRF